MSNRERLDQLAKEMDQLSMGRETGNWKKITAKLRVLAEQYNELMEEEEEQYEPVHGWVCAHCGFRFYTAEDAYEHFGETPDTRPLCPPKGKKK